MLKARPSENSWPVYADDEIEAVARVLKSGKVNQWTGEHVFEFENEFANQFDVPYAIAVANGTAALEIALYSFKIGVGDEVIVTSRSFVASASCVLSVGAMPIFSDVDMNSQNISIDTIRPLITPNTKAIIPVHLAGWPCEMPAICELANEHNLIVIEDCAQAIGAELNHRPVGSFGQAATFSFCQDKIISTGGEGGMLIFRDSDRAQWARSYKDHGKKASYFNSKPQSRSFHYIHDKLGTNLRMTEMQAAIGRIQLSKLDNWLTLRQRNAEILRQALQALPCLRIPKPPGHIKHANYKFYAFLDPDKLAPGVQRDDVLDALNESGIRAFSGSCPELYLEKVFEELAVETRPQAQSLGQWSLMFEIHPSLCEQQLQSTAVQAANLISTFAWEQ